MKDNTAADSAEIPQLIIVTRPNSSLPVAKRLLFFMVMLLLSMVISVGFALVGAWLILPFSGLEVLALGWALYYISCHDNDYESIVVSGGSLVVEKRSHRSISRTEFQRYWVKVVVLPASTGGRCRVWLRSGGKEVELGEFVNDEERMALADRLKLQAGAGYRD